MASWFAVQYRDEAKQNRDQSDKLRAQADQLRDEDRQVNYQALNLRRQLYDAQMSRIQVAWELNDRNSIPKLLDSQRPAQTGGTDLRGFEWYFWQRRKPTPIYTLPEESVVHSDGRHLATFMKGAQGRGLTLWDAATGTKITTLPPDPQGIGCMVFSPDGRFRATADRTKTGSLLRLYEAAGAKLLRSWECPVEIYAMEFRQDGKRLAGTCADGTAHVWDVETGTPLSTFRWPHPNSVFSGASIAGALACFAVQGPLATVSELRLSDPFPITSRSMTLVFRPNTGRLLWSGHSQIDGKEHVTVCDPDTGQMAVLCSGMIPSGSALSPDGKIFAQFYEPGTDPGTFLLGLFLFDAETGREVQRLLPVGTVPRCVAWTPDSKRIAAGCQDCAVIVWDTNTWREVETIRGHKGEVTDVSFTADGKHLISSDSDETKAWDISGDADAHAVFPNRRPFFSTPEFSFSADGAHLAALGGPQQMVTIWDVKGRQVERTITGSSSGLGLVFSPREDRLAHWLPWSSVVWLSGVGAGPEVSLGSAGGDPAFEILGCQFSSDGRTLAYCVAHPKTRGSLERRIIVGAWNLETRKQNPTIDLGEGHPPDQLGAIRLSESPALSADCQSVALRFKGEETLTVCDATNGKRLLNTDIVSTFAVFSPNGRLIAGCNHKDGTLAVWDTETRKRVATLNQVGSPAYPAVFSPDSRRVAAVTADGVHVWNLDTQNEVLSLKGMKSVQFSPDGRFFACGDAEGNIHVWNVEPKE